MFKKLFKIFKSKIEVNIDIESLKQDPDWTKFKDQESKNSHKMLVRKKLNDYLTHYVYNVENYSDKVERFENVKNELLDKNIVEYFYKNTNSHLSVISKDDVDYVKQLLEENDLNDIIIIYFETETEHFVFGMKNLSNISIEQIKERIKKDM